MYRLFRRNPDGLNLIREVLGNYVKKVLSILRIEIYIPAT